MSEYLTATEAAEKIGCSEALIRKRIKTGAVRAKKMGGRWSIHRDDLKGQAVRSSGSKSSNSLLVDDLVHEPPVISHRTEPHDESDSHRIAPNRNDVGNESTSHRIAPHRTEIAVESDSHRIAPNRTTDTWRDDLLAQIADLTQRADRVEDARTSDAESHKTAFDRMRQDYEQQLAEQRQRLDDLAEQLSRRDQTIVSRDETLAANVGRLESLEDQLREAHTHAETHAVEWARRSDDLSHKIADLVATHQEAEARIIELQPVADQVPMLQAAVDESNGEITDMRREVQRIESGLISGPIFRLLDRGGKLRR
jgi:excisionase family DNA binding protein